MCRHGPRSAGWSDLLPVSVPVPPCEPPSPPFHTIIATIMTPPPLSLLSRSFVQAPERAAEDEADSGALVDVADCAREVGGLLLRGKKCILCKSLTGEWTGWRVPSVERDVDDGESPLACAVRSVSELCEIDGEDEVVPLPEIAPGLCLHAAGPTA